MVMTMKFTKENKFGIRIDDLIKAQEAQREERDLYFLEESLASLKSSRNDWGVKVW